MREFLQAAQAPDLATACAVISPHAGYPCSGSVAGASFRALASLPAADRVVYLMGPAHWAPVFGVGLTSASAFATPLGEVAVAVERVAQLLALDHGYHLADAAHTPEHCLEVELPFLQVALLQFRIVPMLFDEEANVAQVAADLAFLLAAHPADLVVVSSDLSHYHPYAEAMKLDRAFLSAVVAGNRSAAEDGEACGKQPILCLMQLAAHFGWQAHFLAYANSGDTCGPKSEVVGYGAVAFTETMP